MIFRFLPGSSELLLENLFAQGSGFWRGGLAALQLQLQRRINPQPPIIFRPPHESPPHRILPNVFRFLL
jgi:hypothetical protein